VARVRGALRTAGVFVAILLAPVPAQVNAGAPAGNDAAGDNGLVVNYAGAPRDCYRPCSLMARDELPADDAANVVERRWLCARFNANSLGPNLASPADGSTSTSCAPDKVGLWDVEVQRKYVDGHEDVGRYQVFVRDPPPPPDPAPISIAARSKLTSPGKVVVYSRKQNAVLGWKRAAAVGDGVLLRRRAAPGSGPHAGEYAFTFVITAPRGKVQLEARASNGHPADPGTEFTVDEAKANTFVTRFVERPFRVLQRFVGWNPNALSDPTAWLVVLTPQRLTWHTAVLVQQRQRHGPWRRIRRSRTSGRIGGYPEAKYDPRYLLSLTAFNKDKRDEIARGMCAGTRYRFVGRFDVRDAHGKQMLRPKQRAITRPLALRHSCG
jgi:hypothetical protein